MWRKAYGSDRNISFAAEGMPSLNKDAPSPREAHAYGRILSVPLLGGLHHQYIRI
jgi:hypothetical protein